MSLCGMAGKPLVDVLKYSGFDRSVTDKIVQYHTYIFLAALC